jgi:hypothetical protein
MAEATEIEGIYYNIEAVILGGKEKYVNVL